MFCARDGFEALCSSCCVGGVSCEYKYMVGMCWTRCVPSTTADFSQCNYCCLLALVLGLTQKSKNAHRPCTE